MKKILKQLFFLSLLVTVFASCKKDENKVYFEGGTSPVLTSTATGPFILDIAHRNDHLLDFAWTNPDYQFNTGLSSQDVSYTLQIDTAGVNFGSAGKAEISISNDLLKSFTVGELNTKLLAAGLIENVAYDVEFRIKASLTNNSVPLYSNVVKMTLTPFLDVLFPVPANLYITGSATPASWQCGCGEPPAPGQTFTKVSSSKFELTVTLSANNSYLFLPVYGSWSAKYGFDGGNNANNVDGDKFKPDGGDMKAPGATRPYKITVDFKTGKFSVTPA